MGVSLNAGFGGGAVYLLLLLIKLLFVIFIVSLVVGGILYIKNSIFSPQEIEHIKRTVQGQKLEQKRCPSCEKQLKADWKVCPYCGKQLETENQTCEEEN